MHNFFRKNNKKLSKLRAQKASSSTFEEVVVVDRYDSDLAIGLVENVFEESIPNPTEYNMEVIYIDNTLIIHESKYIVNTLIIYLYIDNTLIIYESKYI